MAATTYGTVGKYGLTDESSNGLYAQSLSCAVTVQQQTYGDHVGDIKALALYAEQAEISLSGVVTVANTVGQGAIASVLSIANTDIYGGADTTASSFAVTSLTLNRFNTDFSTGDCSAIGFPGVTVS